MASEMGIQSGSSALEHVWLNISWEDVICPICLDSPHNGVLLRCSSHEKGCQPFICDTDHMHSNCLNRLKSANGITLKGKISSSSESTSEGGSQLMVTHSSVQPACPLCRGEVKGWVVIEKARLHLNAKKRCCQGENCTYMGNYSELQNHAKLKHPHMRPSELDPARQLDWENLQQSSEIIDVLSTIHSEVPHGVVLGDYVIEYGEEDMGDEYEDFPGDDGNWWTSCILYQVFDNFRASRNRQRSRVSETRGGHRRSSYDSSNVDNSSVTSIDTGEYRFDEIDEEFVNRRDAARESSSHHSSRRRRSHFHDH